MNEKIHAPVDSLYVNMLFERDMQTVKNRMEELRAPEAIVTQCHPPPGIRLFVRYQSKFTLVNGVSTS